MRPKRVRVSSTVVEVTMYHLPVGFSDYIGGIWWNFLVTTRRLNQDVMT